MKRGHVTGDKQERRGSGDWYNEIQEGHLTRLEAEQAATPEAATSGQAATPEALCSVNLHFTVQGYGQAQATGRGATPTEAVRNLTGTMAATITALAPCETPPYYQKLGRVLAKGLARTADDPALQQRLVQALGLVVAGAVSPGLVTDTVFYVSDAGQTYYVNEARACTCPDAAAHVRLIDEAPYRCTHVLAVLLAVTLGSPDGR